MNVIGKTMLFKNEYGYSTSISHKNQDGEYERMYVAVQLPKGTELENKTEIDITKGFLSTYKSKEEQRLKIVVMEYKIETPLNITILSEDDDLPF